MLTQKEKKVLNYINEHYTVGADVDTADIREKSGLHPHEFDMTCQNLAQKGYFEDFYNNLALASYHFTTTYKSANYHEIERMEQREFIIQSILVPIITGIFSAVLTALILLNLGS